MMTAPTIVVRAYNRPAALRRLLEALSAARYPAGAEVGLVLSVDRGDQAANLETVALAQAWAWSFGPKQVIHHAQPLGLVGNVYFCLELAETHGDLILLEDDLLVAPVFYHYAAQALDFYRADAQIACEALYSLWFNGYTQEPFVPLPDESDVFFVQAPYLQGLAFTREQALRFNAWRAQAGPAARPAPGDALHPLFQRFPADEWYPSFAKYGVVTGRFTVYPRTALCVGMGDAGAHFARPIDSLQTPLQAFQTHYRFKPLADSAAVYDAFFEMLPERLNRLTPALREVEYAVDLYATKSPHHLTAPYVLTTRPWRAALRTYGRRRWPMELNVAEAVPGDDIALCRPGDLRWGYWADLEARRRAQVYFNRRRRTSRTRQLLFWLLGGWAALKARLARR